MECHLCVYLQSCEARVSSVCRVHVPPTVLSRLLVAGAPLLPLAQSAAAARHHIQPHHQRLWRRRPELHQSGSGRRRRRWRIPACWTNIGEEINGEGRRGGWWRQESPPSWRWLSWGMTESLLLLLDQVFRIRIQEGKNDPQNVEKI